MSAHSAKPLQRRDHLYLGYACLRQWLRRRHAASPQVGTEPTATMAASITNRRNARYADITHDGAGRLRPFSGSRSAASRLHRTGRRRTVQHDKTGDRPDRGRCRRSATKMQWLLMCCTIKTIPQMRSTFQQRERHTTSRLKVRRSLDGRLRRTQTAPHLRLPVQVGKT